MTEECNAPCGTEMGFPLLRKVARCVLLFCALQMDSNVRSKYVDAMEHTKTVVI